MSRIHLRALGAATFRMQQERRWDPIVDGSINKLVLRPVRQKCVAVSRAVLGPVSGVCGMGRGIQEKKLVMLGHNQLLFLSSCVHQVVAYQNIKQYWQVLYSGGWQVLYSCLSCCLHMHL